MKHKKEKERIDELRQLTKKREELLLSLQEAERRYDLVRVADLKSGEIPKVEYAIEQLEGNSDNNLMLTETVCPDHIAAVVSRRTGIPLTRLGKNEKERLIWLAERLHNRVKGWVRKASTTSRFIPAPRLVLVRLKLQRLLLSNSLMMKICW